MAVTLKGFFSRRMAVGSLRHSTKAAAFFFRSPSRPHRALFATSTRENIYFFDAATCILPHPAKKKGGEDAAFSSTRYLGVSDGVSGWTMSKIDAGLYSLELLHRVKQALHAHNELPGNSAPEPLPILKEAYYKTRAIGSATCCLVFLDEINRKIRMANLGDSGCILYRKSKDTIVARSQFQSHDFNFPLQLGTGSSDVPEHSDLVECAAKPGDIVVLATDGLWDNLYEYQVTEVLAKCDTATEAAQQLTETAFRFSQDRDWFSPFSKKEKEYSVMARPMGGKPDDISVAVGIVRDVNSCAADELPDSVTDRLK